MNITEKVIAYVTQENKILFIWDMRKDFNSKSVIKLAHGLVDDWDGQEDVDWDKVEDAVNEKLYEMDQIDY